MLATGALRAAAGASTSVPGAARLPSPSTSGVDHIVVLCMENRSFDHFLGWVRGANGRQAGLSYADSHGNPHGTHHLTDWSGCGFSDPDHSYDGGRLQLNGGQMDGFRKGTNDDFALGYYHESDLPTTSQLVRHFTIFDAWFCSILGPTYPNRFYTHAGTTDRIDNTTATSSLPTIWDRLTAGGVPANYYFSDLPFLGLFGAQHIPLARPVATFFAQAATGTLPAFSYLDPFFLGEDQGGSNDDHPHADIRRGQSFVAQVVNAVLSSPTWERTVLVITYDEWGGFFDHVAPPVRADNGPLLIGGRPYQRGQAGFRVPTFVISPFARPGRVVHDHYDHTSILKFVEWRFGLKPLQPRDASARNLAEALDFGYRNRTTSIPSVLDPGPHVCSGHQSLGVGPTTTGGAQLTNSDPIWEELRDSPALRAWRNVG